MEGLIAYELAPGYEEFSGGNVTLVGGVMYDVKELLDESNGRIVLGPNPRTNADEEVPDEEAERANRDAEIADALSKYPALERVEAEDGDEPLSYDNVDLTTVSEGPTKIELRERANELDIPGRSSMTKGELIRAIAETEEALASAEQSSGESTDQGGDAGDAGDGEASTEGSDD
jgi:hypothetical protein